MLELNWNDIIDPYKINLLVRDSCPYLSITSNKTIFMKTTISIIGKQALLEEK